METTQDAKSGTSRKSPNSRKYVEVRSREHLLQEEVEVMREGIKKKGSRHAHRDSTLILLIYRHGLRVEEVANLKWEQIDFASGNIHVRRIKGGLHRPNQWVVTKCGLCGSSNESIQFLRLYFNPAVKDRSRTIRFQESLKRLGNWQSYPSLFTPICFDMAQVTTWLIKELIRAQFRRI